MKRATDPPDRQRMPKGGRPRKPAKRLPTVRRRDLPRVALPGQTRSRGGKTKLTNHRAAIILHAIGCGCYRETAAELAGVKAETLSHWMGWSGEPYETFQRLVRKAEADLEARMVSILTGQAEVRPELALAILERKFPQRWAKVSVVAAPPQQLNFDLASILQKVQERVAQSRAQRELPASTIINTTAITKRPHDPRPPRLAVVSRGAADDGIPTPA
ncbi:MAG: hypothetical protein ACREA0_13505 [bacterium]